jgi:hypothetical protein
VGAAADVVGGCDAGVAELLREGRVGPPGDAVALAGLPLVGMLAVPLNRPVGDGDGGTADVEPVLPIEGEKIAGMEDEGAVVQAETDAERRRVAVPQPAAVSLDLITLMRPPCTRQAAE